MKLILASWLGLALTASALGQHGGGGGHGGGGFSHMSSGSFSGRSYAAPSFSSPSAPAYRPNVAVQRGYSSGVGPAPFGGTYPYNNGNRRPYSSYRPYAYSRSVYLVPGWLGAGYYDYGYSTGSSDPQGGGPGGYAQAGPAAPDDEQAYAPMPARPPYQPDSIGSSDLPQQPPVTLLFKDGRPAEQVQNYAVTRTTFYNLDGGRRIEIPLEQLDLPRTEKTNRDAGVDFEVPAG
jgi:hypothetical protein